MLQLPSWNLRAPPNIVGMLPLPVWFHDHVHGHDSEGQLRVQRGLWNEH